MGLGMIYVVRGTLTGIGDALFQLINGIVEVVGRFTVPVLMTTYLGFGDAGIWLSSGAVWVLSAFTAWLRYRSYFYKKILLASNVMPYEKERPADLIKRLKRLLHRSYDNV